VSEDEVELETETAGVRTPDAPSGTPPAKITAATRPGSSGDGGRRASKAPGFFARTVQFLRDTRAEMRRVSWPNATLVRNSTIITLVAVVFFALYLFAIDRVWALLIGYLRSWLGG
jgi:preprotein translocase SecE subunit